MGCGGSNLTPFPSVNTHMETLSIPDYDVFYNSSAKNLMRLDRAAQQLNGLLDQFQACTGLHGPPERSIGHGIIAWLVGVASYCNGDFKKINLRFVNDLPGILIDSKSLPGLLDTAYDKWLGLCMMIDKAVEELEEVHTEMLQSIDWANVIPDKMLKQALDEGTSIIEFRRIESLAIANSNNLEEGGALLARLLKSVKEHVLESTDTIVEFSKLTNLNKIKTLGEAASARNLTDPREIIEAFGSEIDNLFTETVTKPE